MQDVPSVVSAIQFYVNSQPSLRYTKILHISSLLIFIRLEYYCANLMLDFIFLVFGKHYSFSVILRNCCLRNLCNYHSVSLRGRNVYVQFSSHRELTTMDQNQGREDEVGFILVFLY